MQVCGDNEEVYFLEDEWKRSAQVLLREAKPHLLGKAYAKLVWGNRKQPRFASVFCKVLKDQGALVLTQKGDESKLATNELASVAQQNPARP